jgi:hypothetical protein
MPDHHLKVHARSWRQGIELAAKRERATGVPQSGRKEAAEKLRARIDELLAEYQPLAGSKREQAQARQKYKARLERLLSSLEAPSDASAARARSGRYDSDELEATQARLMEEASQRHALHLAARVRWQLVLAQIRDRVFAATWRAVAQLPDGRTLPFSATEWQQYWPAGGTAPALLQYEGYTAPASVLIGEAEIDRDFPRPEGTAPPRAMPDDQRQHPLQSQACVPAPGETDMAKSEPRPKRPQRGMWQPTLKQYMNGSRKSLEDLDDITLAGNFQRYMTERHPTIPLSRRGRVIKKIEQIRRALGWKAAPQIAAEAANGS